MAFATLNKISHQKKITSDSLRLKSSCCYWFQARGNRLLLYYVVLMLLPLPHPPSSSISSPSQSSVKSVYLFAEAGVMKKMKEKMKDKKKEKEKGGGCVPEIVAIKKTRVVPVAVPVKSAQSADEEYQSAYSPPPASDSGNKYNSNKSPPQPQYAAPPASSPYMPPQQSYGGGGGYGPSEAVGGGYGGGYETEKGMSGYPEEHDEDGHDDDEEEEGYEEHEEGYGVEGDAAVGYESGGHEDEDDEYRRRSGNESISSTGTASTSASVIEYTSLVKQEPTRTSDVRLSENASPQRRSKRESTIALTKSTRLVPRIIDQMRQSSHPGNWRFRGSVLFMQQSSW
jgi:hypothetical protein